MMFAESTQRPEGGIEEEKESLLDTCPDKQYLVLSILAGLKSVPNFASQISTFVDASTYFCSPKQPRTPEDHAYPVEPILSAASAAHVRDDSCFGKLEPHGSWTIRPTLLVPYGRAVWRAGSEDVTPLSALRDQLGLKPHEKYHVKGKIHFNHFLGACEYIRAPTLVQALKSRAAILRSTQAEYFEFVILGKSVDKEIHRGQRGCRVRSCQRPRLRPAMRREMDSGRVWDEIWVIERVEEKWDEI